METRSPKSIILLGYAMLGLAISTAGGSWESVKIKSFHQLNSTDYELVVIPEQMESKDKDPYIGNCTEFTVKGSYA